MNDKVVIAGTVKLKNTIKAKTSLHNVINGTPSWVVNTGGGGIVYPHYSGPYAVTPSESVQTLDTSDKVMDDDVTVNPIPSQYIIPTGAKTITENGTHDVAQYESAVVDVQGGITPTGTKQITANGTSIDVYNYQYADVAVPNSYSAGDEGKVVSNGALVAQTSDTVTANDTYDTTLINSLTVNVSGGGGASGGLANMVDVTDTDVSFAYMLSAMKNGNTTGGTVTYTTAFSNTDTLILSTGLTTLHGIMFAPTSYDTKSTASNVQSNKFVLIQLYDDAVPAKYLIYGFGGNNNGVAKPSQTLGTAYTSAPENGTITISGGDLYFKGRYNKNASYQLLMTDIQYEWIAW